MSELERSCGVIVRTMSSEAAAAREAMAAAAMWPLLLLALQTTTRARGARHEEARGAARMRMLRAAIGIDRLRGETRRGVSTEYLGAKWRAIG